MTQQPAPLSTPRSAFGSFLILRAIPAAALAVVITFSADHSSIVGELAFMVFGFVMAPVFVLTAFASGFTGRVRSAYVVSAAAAIVSAAVMAIVIAMVVENAGFGAQYAAPIARKALDFYIEGKWPKEIPEWKRVP